jgi:large repetitive protein
MRKPTILRTLIFVLAMLLNFASYSQNGIAYNSKFPKNLNENIFLKAKNQSENPFSLDVDKTAAVALTNPVIKYAQAPFLGTVSRCPNDGKELPKLFLCGNNDSRNIQTGIAGAQSIIWEKFRTGGGCAAASNVNCANETAAASCWQQVGTVNSPDYSVNSAGQYRIRIVDNTGTPYIFYFNVYQNTLDLGAVAKNDIISYNGCIINGKVTVSGFGSAYEYSLTTGNSGVNWQASNVFDNITTPGTYNVYVRLKGVSGSCDFKVSGIVIKRTVFTVTTLVTSPNCAGEPGSIKVSTNGDVSNSIQYNYKISRDGSVVGTYGPTTDISHTFTDLQAGNNGSIGYAIETSVEGTACMVDNKWWIPLNGPANKLTAISTVSEPLTACSNGKISVSASGGTPNYKYFVSKDGAGFVSNSNSTITVTAPGTYDIRVDDSKGCSVTTTVVIPSNAKPDYEVKSNNSACYSDKTGISIDVTNTNGYTLAYSINNGSTFQSDPNFFNVSAGTYNVVVKYSITYPITAWPYTATKSCTDPAQKITISAPATALSASGGVGELSGCGPPGEEIKGLLRITNPRGGVPYAAPDLYRYSFDGGKTFGKDKQIWAIPGTYTLVIQDSNGCTFTMPDVTIDPKPAPPSIDVLDPVFNCDGTATSTVTINGGSGDDRYSYEYFLDGKLNTNVPPNVFPNVRVGDHTITVTYKVVKVSTYSNLLEEDFGSGGNVRATGITEETSPGIENGYCFHDLDLPSTCANKAATLEDNQYVVTKAIIPNNSAWFPFRDHTSNGTNPNGRFLAINIGKAAGANGVLYSKQINDVIPGQPIIVEAYLANLFRADFVGSADPSFSFELVDGTGKVIAQQPPVPPTPNPGGVPPIPPILRSNKWELRTVSLDPGNNTTLIFRVISGSTRYDGNDGAIDDIKVYQLPKACKTTVKFDVTVDPAKQFAATITNPFDAKCNGQNNGGLTITAQNFDPAYGFDYSLDNGVKWVNSKVAKVDLDNLGAGNYNIKVRYNDQAGSCTIPFTQLIKAPAILEVKASIKLPATCKVGATILVEAKGGTPTYEYELKDATGTNTVKPRTTSNEFTDVAEGTYKVVVYDKYNCPTAVDATIIVTAPPKIVAVIASSSNLCYSPSNKATLVVTVSGGTAPFKYSLNGGAKQDSNTFKDLVPDSYVITVSDANSCTQDTETIVIEPELSVLATVTQTLKCVTPPATSKAIITGTISGGRAPFGVTLLSGPGTGTIDYPTATTFTFTGTVPGIYTFEISDSQKFVCKTTAEAEIKSPTNPVADAKPTNPKCFGAATGSVVLSGSAGSGAGYEYNFDNKGFSDVSVYSNLKAGVTYSYQVKDGNGCVSTVKTFQLTEPIQITGDIKATEIGCNGNNTVDAVVTVTGSNGVAPYKYSFNNNTSFTLKNTFSTSAAGKVTAYIQDANGCEIGPLEITIGAKVLITALKVISDSGLSCPANTATVTIKADGGVSPIKYKIISPTVSAENTDGIFAGLTPGAYTFQAVDKNGCNLPVDHTVSSSPAINVTGKVVTPIKCFGDKGAIQYTVSGTTRFAYDILNSSNLSVGSSNDTNVLVVDLNNLLASKYTITVTDKVTNCKASYSVDLTQPAAAVSVIAIPTKITCTKFRSDIAVTVSGGTPTYYYAVAKSTDPVPTSFGTLSDLTVDTNLGVNKNWIVYVKDANGCPASIEVTIDSEPLPTVTAVLKNQCTATGTGNIFEIEATGANGASPYKYSINGKDFQTSQTFNVPAGTYTVTVEDNNGCRVDALAKITVNPKLAASASVTKELDCSTSPDAEITVEITGGKGPYNYTIQKGTGTPSGPFTITAGPIVLPVSAANADKYTFAITDANLCTISTNATVKTISNPVVSVKKSANPLCNGDSNGSIELEATGGSGGGYQYSLDGSPFSSQTYYPNLGDGNHTFKIIDGKGCEDSGSLKLTAPSQLHVQVVESKFSCNTSNTNVAGTVTVNVTTGTGSGPYKYFFNGKSSATNVLTLNDNGSDQAYTYKVTDNNGCSVSGSGTLTKLNPPTILEIKGTPVYCAPTANTFSDVTVTLNANTGVGTLSYVITAPASQVGNVTGATDGKFKGLPTGAYTFKVTDGNNCYAIGFYKVDPPVNIVLDAKISKQVLCKGDQTGVIKMDVTAFKTSYKYSVNGGAEVPGQTLNTIYLPGLKAGVLYDILVTDEETSCTATAQLTLTEPTDDLSAIVVQKNAYCDVPTSKITVTPSGGTSTYKYAYVQRGVDPSTSYGLSNTADLGTVPTGNWDVWVKDANGCTFKTEISVTKDSAPTVTADITGQCLGVGDYTITATGSGTGTLEYSINNGGSFQPGNTFIVTASGNYSIMVRDANGCTATTATDVVVAPKLTLDPVFNKNITCVVGDEAAKVTLTTGGGTPGYTYTSSPATGTFSGPLGNIFTTTSPGTYTFTVKDARGCTVTSPITIEITPKTDPVITKAEELLHVTCHGAATASLDIIIDKTQGESPFLINVYNNTTSTDYKTQTTGLTAGVYKITLTDAKGCTAIKTVTIGEPDAISFGLAIESIQCNPLGGGNTLGSIEVKDVDGGTLPYTYHISNNFGSLITPNTYIDPIGKGYTFRNIIDFGLYTVNVVDANGCNLSHQIVMASPPSDLDIDITTTPATCASGGTAIVKAIAVVPGNDYEIGILTSNSPPYSTDYHDVASPTYTYTFNNLTPGVSYTFVVHDKNSDCYFIKVGDPISAVPSMTTVIKEKNVTCTGSKNGSVVFTASNVDNSVTTVEYQIFATQSNAAISPVLIHTVTPAGDDFTSPSYPELLPSGLPIPGHNFLAPGEYYIVFIEKMGAVQKCKSASLPFTIKESPVELSLIASAPNNVNCKTDSGIITAIASNGTAPYKYQFLLATDPAPVESSTLWSDANTYKTNVSGNYTVYAMDAFGCIKPFSVQLKEDVAPSIASIDPICFDGSEFTITVPGTVSVGTPMYSINGSNFQTSASFKFNASGTYNIKVKDGNDCTADLVYEVYPQLGLGVKLKEGLDCTTKPKAEIILTASGGNTNPAPSYTYEYSLNGSAVYTPITLLAGNIFEAATPGDYTFRLTDTSNLTVCQITKKLKIDPIPAIIFNTVETNLSCNGSDNGTIKVNLTGGVGKFKYTLTDGTTTWGPQDSNEFLDLKIGTYDVTVIDGTSCELTKTGIIITQPLTLDASATVGPYNCDPVTNNVKQAIVTINVAAGTGTGPYKYKFGSAIDYDDVNTLAVTGTNATQNISYSVQDGNGCIFNGTVPVDPYIKLTGLVITPTDITCAKKQSDVTVLAQGGYPGYTYEILEPATAISNVTGKTSGVFIGLDPGTYLFKATDNNGCSYQNSVEIKQVVNITAVVSNEQDMTCNESPAISNGQVAFTIANFKGAYDYILTGPATGVATKVNYTGYDIITVTGLSIGTYKIDIKDLTTDCIASATAVVGQPATPLDITIQSNKNANCKFGAKVVVQATGGTQAYKYAFAANGATPVFVSGPNANSATLDPSKTWIAYVEDANLCTAQVPLPLATDALPVIDPISSVCYKVSDGPVYVTLTGTVATGTGPARFNIGNGWTYNDTFKLDAPGDYFFSIMDGNDCISTIPFKYTVNQELLLTADKKSDITCKVGAAGSAVIELKATQGSLIYNTIEVSTDNGVSFAPITSNPFITNTAGTYLFKVQDDAGCEAVSLEVIVLDKTYPIFTYVKEDITCFGNNNGTIAITPSKGLAPYKYSIDGGTTYDPVNSKFIGLAKGVYHVYVMDANECITNQDVTIGEPDQLVVAAPVTPFGCNADNTTRDAVVTLNATFGTSPYSYSFDDGDTFSDTKNTLTVSSSQTIKYVVVDKNGCRVSGSAVVPVYNAPKDMVIEATPIYCKTTGGVATVTVTSVAGPPVGTAYTYEIIQPVSSATSNNNGIFPNLLPDTYQIKVTDDASHCYSIGSIEVKKASEISVDAQTYNDVLCNGDSTGSVTFAVSNYITAGDYSYNLVANPIVAIPTPTQVGDLITYAGLSKGSYTFTVTDNVSDCTDQVVDFLIGEPAAPLSFGTVVTDINCIKKKATITVTAAGGTTGYKYAVLEAGDLSAPVYGDNNILEVDTNNGTKLSWLVYVKDLNNCPVQATQNIATAPLPGGITIDPYSQCPDDITHKYTFTVKVATGIAPFTYSLNGVDFQDDPTFIVDAAGEYTITVKDANGCTIEAATKVIIAPVLQLKYKVTLPNCFELGGIVDVSAQGGSSSANYVYSLDNNGFPQNGPTASFTGVTSGAHFIEVFDTVTLCKDRIDFNITPASPIDGFDAKGTNVSCFGSTDGKITASIPAGPKNDNPDYKYKLFGTTKGSAVKDVDLPLQDSGVFENLKPGDYTVTVVSGRGCEALQFVRIAEPALITLDPPVIVQYLCTTGNDVKHATITVDLTKIAGGSGDYITFQFIRDGVQVYEGPSNVFTETDFVGGKYIVNVIDSKKCIGTSPESEVFRFIGMDKIVIAKTPITCAKKEDIVVTVKAVDGTPITVSLLYKIEGTGDTVYNANNTDGKFTDLPVGSYFIYVENPATGCIIKTNYFVNDPNTFDLIAGSIVDVKCYGAFDGSVTLTMVDNLPPVDALEFTYIIKDDLGNPVTSGTSNADGTITINGLKAGVYKAEAVLTGPSLCPVETIFTINQASAELKIFESHTPISCIPGNDGTITIKAEGGWPGDCKFELRKGAAVISAYSDTFKFIDLDSGTYTLNVIDAKGCVATMSVQLDNPKQIQGTATATASILTCYGDKNGEIKVTAVSGGEEKNYSYTLNILSENPVITSGPQVSPVFSGLAPGKYSVTITDGLQCKGITNEVTIEEPVEVVATLVQESGITCLTDARLTLTATGGTGPYEYSTDQAFNTVLGTVPATFAVGLGDHQYYVRDSKGCVSVISGNVQVNALTPLTLKLDLDNALVYCKTEASASIDATGIGGLGNYVYSLKDNTGATIRPSQPDGYFDLLPAGSYTVHVVSGDCEYDSAAIVISEPDTKLSVTSVKTDVSCFAANDGKIVITATGGTGIIKYAISPNLAQFDDIFIFDRLAPGTYTVIAQDESGCLGDGPLTIIINEPAILGAKVVGPIMQEICDGDNDGEFSIEIAGGTPPYTVSLDKENGTYVPVTGTQHDFKNLKGGIHNVYIKDASCLIKLQVNMDKAVILNPTYDINYDCVNNAQTNMVTVTVDKSNIDLSQIDYALDSDVGPFQPSNIFTNVAPGRHYIVARHTNGCKVPTASFDIKAYVPLTLVETPGQKELNIISVTAGGGAPSYEYSFNGEPFTSSNRYKIYKTGDYVVIVRDKNGCTVTITVPAIYVDVCLDNYFTPAGVTNTTWGPGCTNIYNNLEFSIFDRYGRVIVKYHYGQKWDGRYNGAELPSGDYWYVLKLNDPKDDREFVGHFTLYR